ncbi:hypothetical protein DCS_02612 [Drechmeria coniospora]|uniref:Short chain dehydrogenase n=1 Tax=Drechmeria coniospora TaxID=98403 RepID=A0A151GWL9_DRECN|nr:hypothetical protein DCS_02612 [Drechmeria coniospora]KYK61470.1 hypothetical protein DCS_02612 [Drechmeria coniospora]ODA81232.1 hypothetical protein RJ55_04196 [Drechmeria coniospora]
MAGKKIILITGANSGIGYDATYTIADASPDNHVVMACRSLDKGTKALEELQARKPAGSISLIQLDVTDDNSIKAAAEKLTADFGVLDVLINNAGIYLSNPKDRRSEIFDTINTNTAGPLILTESLVPLLRKSADARVVNVSSGLGSISLRLDDSTPYYAIPAEAYRMSKAALNMASACMYANYRPWGAKVWAYCPGYVVTNLTGEGDRERRKEEGAEDSQTSADGLLEIINGKRDGEVGLFLQRRGERFDW